MNFGKLPVGFFLLQTYAQLNAWFAIYLAGLTKEQDELWQNGVFYEITLKQDERRVHYNYNFTLWDSNIFTHNSLEQFLNRNLRMSFLIYYTLNISSFATLVFLVAALLLKATHRNSITLLQTANCISSVVGGFCSICLLASLVPKEEGIYNIMGEILYRKISNIRQSLIPQPRSEPEDIPRENSEYISYSGSTVDNPVPFEEEIIYYWIVKVLCIIVSFSYSVVCAILSVKCRKVLLNSSRYHDEQPFTENY